MALDYFLCPGEVQEIYGQKPKKLEIRFAYDYLDDVFPQFYKLYGKSAGLKAYSDGIKLWTRGTQPGEWIESAAPSKEDLHKQGFRSTATLKFVLPKVSLAGEYHIETHSFNSIVQLNSSIDYIKHLFGRIQGLPLQLLLEPREANITIDGKPAKKTVHVMRLHFEEADIMAFMQKRKQALAQMAERPVMVEAPKMELPEASEDFEEDEEDDLLDLPEEGEVPPQQPAPPLQRAFDAADYSCDKCGDKTHVEADGVIPDICLVCGEGNYQVVQQSRQRTGKTTQMGEGGQRMQAAMNKHKQKE